MCNLVRENVPVRINDPIEVSIRSRDPCRDSRVPAAVARAADQPPGCAGKKMACHRLRHGSRAVDPRLGCGCESPEPASACTTCHPAGSRTNRLTIGPPRRSRPRAGPGRLLSAERHRPTRVGSCLQWQDPLQVRRFRWVSNRLIVPNRRRQCTRPPRRPSSSSTLVDSSVAIPLEAPWKSLSISHEPCRPSNFADVLMHIVTMMPAPRKEEKSAPYGDRAELAADSPRPSC